MIRTLALILSLLWTVPARTSEPPQLRWAGRVEVNEPVTIPAGRVLIVEPGTRIAQGAGGTVRVQGEAYLLGDSEHPISVVGRKDARYPVFQLTTPGAILRLHRVRAENAAHVVEATAGVVIITASAFTENAMGVRIQMKARALVRKSRFRQNRVGLAAANGAAVEAVDLLFEANQRGLALSNSARARLRSCRFIDNQEAFRQHNPGDVEIEDARFRDNRVAVALAQTRRSPRIAFSRFEKNKTAVEASSFSHPLIEACRFRWNTTAFAATQFCGPFLRYNEFAENRWAVRLDHKSGARIEGNRFRENETALFADFSSYPKVERNLFSGNTWHVKLGRFMSSDWERRRGSEGYTLERARERNTRNPVLAGRELPRADGVFSVAHNAWDDRTLEEMSGGPSTNISRIWDGRDQPEVAYPGWGTGNEAFALDVVAFDPPLETAPPVGPGAWRPLQDPIPRPAAGGPRPPRPPGAPSRGAEPK